ncbi:hypothetical protein OROGR_016642 [Orobanche gracilis]
MDSGSDPPGTIKVTGSRWLNGSDRKTITGPQLQQLKSHLIFTFLIHQFKEMKRIGVLLWSSNAVLSRQFQSPNLFRSFSASTFPVTDNRLNLNTSESIDDFEQRIFGGGSRSSSDAFYRQLDKAEKKAHGFGMANLSGMGNKPSFMGGVDGHSTLFDGKDDDLKRAATYFEFDFQEVLKEDYAFRPDVNFLGGMTYDTKDLDLRKPEVRKPARRLEFETTTEDVLLKADFRNVEFLANFITEAGVIIKRSKTGISAKAQRKVAREIKTARAFGLMPFTTMGTKQFKYGNTMQDEDRDFEYEATYEHSFVNGVDDSVDA